MTDTQSLGQGVHAAEEVDNPLHMRRMTRFVSSINGDLCRATHIVSSHDCRMPMQDDLTQFKITCGHRLALARRVLGLDQVALADLMGISRQKVSSAERGTRLVDAEALGRLRDARAIDANWIYHGDASRLPADVATALTQLISLEPPPTLADLLAAGGRKRGGAAKNRETKAA